MMMLLGIVLILVGLASLTVVKDLKREHGYYEGPDADPDETELEPAHIKVEPLLPIDMPDPVAAPATKKPGQ
jgi:hypothetical protein